MPGIDSRAPERTETSSGRTPALPPPNTLPVCFSTTFIAARAWSQASLGILLPALTKESHTSVVMVKPGGTGQQALVISHRPAPLPPSNERTSFQVGATLATALVSENK